MVRRRSVLLLATVLVMVGCTSTHPAPDATATTQTSVVPTTEPPTAIVAWDGGPLVPPFEADEQSLVVLPGDPPSDVSRDQALAVAQRVVGNQVGGFSVTQTVAGRATLSPAVVQGAPGVPDLSDAPAWVVAYRGRVMFSCPAEIGTAPSIPPGASELDAVIVTGAAVDQVVIYHGTGTGPCLPSTAPTAVSATRL